MNTGATLTVTLANEGARSTLQSVLSPDNEGAPRGTSISMAGRDSRLEFRVISESPSTALSMVLAVLRDVSLFQEVWLLSRRGVARAKRV